MASNSNSIQGEVIQLHFLKSTVFLVYGTSGRFGSFCACRGSTYGGTGSCGKKKALTPLKVVAGGRSPTSLSWKSSR
jgi:hypothetical protein